MWPLHDEDVSDVLLKVFHHHLPKFFFQSTVSHSGCWKPWTAPSLDTISTALVGLLAPLHGTNAIQEVLPFVREMRMVGMLGVCRRGKGSWVGNSDWIGSWWHGSCWIMKWCWLILYVPSVTLHDQKENTSQQAMPHAGQREIRITGTTLDQKIGSQTWLPKNACHPTNQSDPDRRKSVGFFLVGSGLKFPSWSYMISRTTKISNSWAPHTSPNSAGDWEQP